MKSLGEIDIEPTWVGLCKGVSFGSIDPSVLLPACELADVVRQAQKRGARSVTFTFVRSPEKSGETDVAVSVVEDDEVGA